MTKFEKISGVINTNTNLSSTSGYIDTIGNRVYGTIGTEHWINFRVPLQKLYGRSKLGSVAKNIC